MIDIKDENLLTLAGAARRFPTCPCLRTIWRWVQKGVKGGVKLETVVIGGRRMTSVEAMDRFIDRINADQVTACASPSGKRQRQIAVAERELSKLSISSGGPLMFTTDTPPSHSAEEHDEVDDRPVIPPVPGISPPGWPAPW